MLIPNNINLKRTFDETVMAINDKRVLIDKGEILIGTLNKKTLGTSQGSLVHIIVNENGIYLLMYCNIYVLTLFTGHKSAEDFLSLSQQVVNYWLEQRGFSVGISDTIADEQTQIDIQNGIEAAKSSVQDLIKQAHTGQLKCKPGMTIKESLEARIGSILDKARDDAGLKATSQLRKNNINTMVNAGSKGSSLNISQIMACVGQQSISGRRIPFKFQDRTLPHFTKFNYGPESRGFVQSSFIKGLTPQEFFFHAVSGRVGLIDTAVIVLFFIYDLFMIYLG